MNRKVYIGLHRGNNVSVRWKEHVNASNNHSKYRQYLHHAMRKYGVSNFEIAVIMHCENYQELQEFEKLYIKHYRSNDSRYGYNLTNGGEGNIGKVYTLEERLARSLRMKGNKNAVGNTSLLGKRWKAPGKSAINAKSFWIHSITEERFVIQSQAELLIAQGWMKGRLPGAKRAPWKADHGRRKKMDYPSKFVVGDRVKFIGKGNPSFTGQVIKVCPATVGNVFKNWMVIVHPEITEANLKIRGLLNGPDICAPESDFDLIEETVITGSKC